MSDTKYTVNSLTLSNPNLGATIPYCSISTPLNIQIPEPEFLKETNKNFTEIRKAYNELNGIVHDLKKDLAELKRHQDEQTDSEVSEESDEDKNKSIINDEYFMNMSNTITDIRRDNIFIKDEMNHFKNELICIKYDIKNILNDQPHNR